MKKLIAFLLALTMILSLCACGGKSTICGIYTLDSVTSEGQKMTPDSIRATASSISIVESDENKLMTLYIEIGDSFHLMKGYVSDESKENDVETYKFWVRSMTGTLSNDLEWLYVNYYPETGIIEIDIEDIAFEFAKTTNTKVDSALKNMASRIEAKNGIENFGFWSDHYDANSDTYHYVYTLDYDAIYAYVVSTGSKYAAATASSIEKSYENGEEDMSEEYSAVAAQFDKCEGITIVIDIVGYDGTVVASYINGEFQE